MAVEKKSLISNIAAAKKAIIVAQRDLQGGTASLGAKSLGAKSLGAKSLGAKSLGAKSLGRSEERRVGKECRL